MERSLNRPLCLEYSLHPLLVNATTNRLRPIVAWAAEMKTTDSADGRIWYKDSKPCVGLGLSSRAGGLLPRAHAISRDQKTDQVYYALLMLGVLVPLFAVVS